jgi:threonine aldolase
MRQSGFLAAACIYALDNHIERLRDDHKRAKELGETLSALPYIENVLPVETNIIIFTLTEKIKSDDFVKRLSKKNIKAVGFGKQTIRFVTHLDFTDDMLEKVIFELKKI